jgi:cytochrome c553
METSQMKKILSLILIMFVSSVFASAGSPDAGKTKSGTCVACHGDDGNSLNPAWPKLAGQYSDYLSKQLFEYRKGPDGDRNDPTMYGMVANLSDEDIHDLSSFYATQKPTIGNARSDLVELGARIYLGGNISSGVTACVACHGPKGLGNNLAGFPKVSGQHAQYINDQLRAFKEGKRANDSAGMMRMISARMSDAEIEAVSSYIEGLH